MYFSEKNVTKRQDVTITKDQYNGHPLQSQN